MVRVETSLINSKNERAMLNDVICITLREDDKDKNLSYLNVKENLFRIVSINKDTVTIIKTNNKVLKVSLLIRQIEDFRIIEKG